MKCVQWLLWYICIAELIWVPYTWENKKTDKISNLCCVQRPRHTAKMSFEACLVHPLPCVFTRAHGKGWLFAMSQTSRHTANALFPISRHHGTFILPSTSFCTRQKLCRVPNKTHTAKCLFADVWMSWALYRVLHTTKTLPCAFRPLPLTPWLP